ncbi:MAG: FeoA family protein [Ferrimonas sp.]
MTLAELTCGQPAVVVGLRMEALESNLRIKLMALGFVAGSVIEVVRHAPFGRGLQVKLLGGALCLTPALAHHVMVALA